MANVKEPIRQAVSVARTAEGCGTKELEIRGTIHYTIESDAAPGLASRSLFADFGRQSIEIFPVCVPNKIICSLAITLGR